MDIIVEHLPKASHLFPKDQLTDKSEKFLVSEIIREKIMRRLGDELPYSVTVEIEEFYDRRKIIHISAIIWAERKGQKKILIGDDGGKIKSIGIDSRLDIERLLNQKVMLNLWVKVKRSWSRDREFMSRLGYED